MNRKVIGAFSLILTEVRTYCSSVTLRSVQQVPEVSRLTPATERGRTVQQVKIGIVRPLFVLVLGAVIPLAVVSFQPIITVNWILVALLAVYSGIRLAQVICDERRPLVRVFFWTYIYVWLGISALAQESRLQFPQTLASTRTDFRTAGLINLVGIITFDLAFSFVRGRHEHQPLVQLNERRVKVFAIIAMAMVAFELHRLGGIHSLLISRQALAAALAPRTHGLNSVILQDKTGLALNELILDTPIFLAAYLLLHLKRDGARWGALGPITLVTSIIVNNPIAQPRQWSGTVILSLYFAYRGPLSVREFRVFASALLFGTLILFPFGNRLRYTNDSNTVATGSVAHRLVVMQDYDSYQEVSAAVGYVHRHGYTFGRQTIGLLGFWLPRSHWASKPQDTGSLIGEDIGYAAVGNTNIAAPVTAEAFVEGGFTAVVFVLAVLGLVMKRVEAYTASLTIRGSPLSLLVPVLAAYQLVILRGPLLPTALRLAALVTIVRLCCSQQLRQGRSVKTRLRFEQGV